MSESSVLRDLVQTLYHIEQLKKEGAISKEKYEELKDKLNTIALETVGVELPSKSIEEMLGLEVEEKLDKYTSFGAFMDDVNKILIRENVPKFSHEIYRKFAKEVWNVKDDEEKVEEIVEKYSEIVPNEDVLDDIVDLLYGEGEEGEGGEGLEYFD
jgi:hypothetical protein